MITFLAKRTATLVAAVLLSSFAVFLIPYVTPGDPVRKIIRSRVAGDVVDDSTVHALSSSLGLQDPLPVQYLRWLGDFLTGDMGLSHISRTPVVDQVMPALGITLSLVLVALGTAVVVSLPLGIVAALKQGGKTDKLITTVTQSFIAMPEYWLAPLLVLVFALRLSMFPSAGWNTASSVVLPAVTLALRPISFFTSAVRAGMIDALDAEHIQAARARGLSRVQTVWRHVIPNGLVPLSTLFAVWFAGLLGGSVIVEVIFAIPGMGRLLYDAVVNSDIPLAQGGVVVVVALAVAITTLADFVHRILSPKVSGALA
ncbi:ABC transporter permease [Paenarthrobacter nicotinovorans]|uniref:ABC transporter permease n=1 Tax=Paenarthrobacter nicotinovorans TaxID=29320 RepID=UPI00036A5F3D|nr:ABC transporter permease [Paenarthrobacter nicotinovorans]KIA73045.1 peptide transport system permease protein [Arthrobacter sp. MWB30]MDI2019641.1 Metal-staphylopine import system permease protein CntB [Paenarthrobacter nicotinovorans]SKB56111.1 peptide/nickel transport system permease protein [Arthrobacter sp. 31Cvi3.1E]